MNTAFDAAIEDITSHLTAERQAWLFGAGISCRSGLPLMGALTQLVASKYAGAEAGNHVLWKSLVESLPADAHIEHILSQIGDYITLAERLKDKKISIGGVAYEAEHLRAIHGNIRDVIRDVIRLGYHPGQETVAPRIATADDKVVMVDHHRSFLRALFASRDKAGRPLRPI